MRLDDLLKFSILKLQSVTSNARQEAIWLFEEVTGWTQSEMILKANESLASDAVKKIDALLKKRLAGEPLAHVLGYQDFFKSRFRVSKDTLIPRPETETLVEEALRDLSTEKALLIADLGTGTGCIGLSLLLERPESRLWACDVSSLALEITRQNAVALGLENRVKYIHGDVIEQTPESSFDVIVANPPYIEETDDRVEESVRRHEPHLALFAENRGLAKYEQWLPWCLRHLKSQGRIYFEFGDGQAEEIKKIATDVGFVQVKTVRDMSGKDRVLVALKE